MSRLLGSNCCNATETYFMLEKAPLISAPQFQPKLLTILFLVTTGRSAPARSTATKRGAAASRGGPVKAPPPAPAEEEENNDPASRVRVSKEGKLIVKGVDKFNKMERSRIVELVCAEKILECKTEFERSTAFQSHFFLENSDS